MMRHQLIAILLLVACIFLLSACAGAPKRGAMSTFESYTDNTPVIFVHGLFGSRIREQATGKDIWPGSVFRFLRNTLFATGMHPSAESLEPKLNPYEAYTPFYGYRPRISSRVWKLLEKHAGYQRCDIDKVYEKGSRCYYFFVYDWRKDLVEVAGELEKFIQEVKFSLGDPKLKVNLVGNSYGGLVVRYYLAYGSEDVLNPLLRGITPTYTGKKQVDKVIYIATPLKGTMLGARALMRGYRFGLAKVHPEAVAMLASLYYLLPHPDTIWMQDKHGVGYLFYDIYSVGTWKRFRLGIFDSKNEKRINRRFGDKKKSQKHMFKIRRYFESRLERAKMFHRALDKYDSTGEYAFYGICKSTPYKAVLEKISSVPRKYFISFYPKKVKSPIMGVDYRELMMRPGDNIVVPVRSGQLERMEVCAKHGSVPVNRYVTRRVLHILLSNTTVKR